MDWVPGGSIKQPEKLNVTDKQYLYAPGKTLEIFSHQPPTTPFDKTTTGRVDQDTLRARGPRDHVFLKLPRERAVGSRLPSGNSTYFAQKDSATLNIEHNIAIEDGTGAQIVLCSFGEQRGRIHKPTAYWDEMGYNESPTKVVAKIFDPLLYPKINSLVPQLCVDVVDRADVQYANEAAAYAELYEAAKKKPVIEDFVPRFYGTWTTLVKNAGWGQSVTRPSDNNGNGILAERPVRIILMEHIKGKSIWNTCTHMWEGPNPTLVPPKTNTEEVPSNTTTEEVQPKTNTEEFEDLNSRLNVFARILHGLVALQHVGVLPLRLRAANFIIEKPMGSRSDYTKQREALGLGENRVVMVGYSSTIVTRYRKNGPCDDEHFPRPRHPAHSQYTPTKLSCLVGWYPPEWQFEEHNKMFLKWMKDGNVFDDKDFTGKDEIDAITKKLDDEWVPPEPKPMDKTTLGLLGYTKLPEPSTGPFWRVPERKEPPPKNQKTGNLATKDSSSASATESNVGSDVDLGSSTCALTALTGSLAIIPSLSSSIGELPPPRGSSSHADLSSGSSLRSANEPSAREGGRRALGSGLGALEEVEVAGGPGEQHDADDEGRPKKETSEAGYNGDKKSKE